MDCGPRHLRRAKVPRNSTPHCCVRANDVCKWKRMGLENVSFAVCSSMGYSFQLKRNKDHGKKMCGRLCGGSEV